MNFAHVGDHSYMNILDRLWHEMGGWLAIIIICMATILIARIILSSKQDTVKQEEKTKE